MEESCSLKRARELLVVVYECQALKSGDLANFLISAEFFARVFSNIQMELLQEKISERITDLELFLEKAEVFKNEHSDFAGWWPDPQREGITKQAYSNIFWGKNGQYERFTIIVSCVMEALEILSLFNRRKSCPLI